MKREAQEASLQRDFTFKCLQGRFSGPIFRLKKINVAKLKREVIFLEYLRAAQGSFTASTRHFSLFYSIFLELSITSTSIYEEMECLDGVIPPPGQQSRSAPPSSYIQIRGAEAVMSVMSSAPYENFYFNSTHYWSQLSCNSLVFCSARCFCSPKPLKVSG